MHHPVSKRTNLHMAGLVEYLAASVLVKAFVIHSQGRCLFFLVGLSGSAVPNHPSFIVR